MPQHMKKLTENALEEGGVKLSNARVCILGLAYIENSDDTRNSPTLSLYKLLKDVCEKVVVHDPYVKEFEGVSFTSNLEEALRDKDCVVIMTRHREYFNINLDWLRDMLTTPVLVDGRNVFNPEECIKAGFSFKGVGIG